MEAEIPPSVKGTSKTAIEEMELRRTRIVAILVQTLNHVCILDELEEMVKREYTGGVNSCIGPIRSDYAEMCSKIEAREAEEDHDYAKTEGMSRITEEMIAKSPMTDEKGQKLSMTGQ